jgi:hypothetical protein
MVALLACLTLTACGEVNSDPTDASAPDVSDAATSDAVDPDSSIPDGGPPHDAEPDGDPSSPDAGPTPPDAGPDAPPAPVCTPGTATCASGQLSICDTNGQYEAPTTCALGCFTDSMRCWDVAPSAGLGGALDGSADKPDVTLADGAVIDTTTGVVRDASGAPVAVPTLLVPQGQGRPQIRVYQVGSLTMGSASVSGVHVLAIVADGAITLRGPVTVSFNGLPRTACTGGDGYNSGGGGAGGHAASGGAGGANRANPGGIAGLPSGFEQAFVLGTGCAGGSYTADDEDSGSVIPVGYGGSGGGAVQLVSRERIVLASAGSSAGGINVGGAGGVSGGGGGSGGLILLEAPLVELTQGAALAANGGGGGGSGTCAGSRGGNGRLAEAAASGGWCIPGAAGGGGGFGVEGSGTTSGSGGGAWATGQPNSAGGGGGSTGLIRINTRENGFSRAPGSVVSPRPSNGVNTGIIGRR